MSKKLKYLIIFAPFIILFILSHILFIHCFIFFKTGAIYFVFNRSVWEKTKIIVYQIQDCEIVKNNISENRSYVLHIEDNNDLMKYSNIINYTNSMFQDKYNLIITVNAIAKEIYYLQESPFYNGFVELDTSDKYHGLCKVYYIKRHYEFELGSSEYLNDPVNMGLEFKRLKSEKYNK